VHEVRDERLVVELALARQLPGQPDMLDVVAENAERAESFEMLDVRQTSWQCSMPLAPQMPQRLPESRYTSRRSLSHAGRGSTSRRLAYQHGSGTSSMVRRSEGI
jgi:hypothetical protein